MLVAAREAGVKRFVYAASSSTYGDHQALPKSRRHALGDRCRRMRSPSWSMSSTPRCFGRCYGFPSIGLRYFNVFGARQDPEGAYAAVIPRWTRALLLGEDR
jgi:UDP-N-acetylglucosamine 4-epimerase